jgi:hypothetical protein
MKLVKTITVVVRIVLCLALVSAAEVASAVVIASDNASNPAYSFEADGAWKGQYAPTDIHQAGQNPPGTDNGGTGFGIWNFTGPKIVDGGFQNPVEPYGNLNHFIDGVDFPTTAYNDLGAPAFGLGNCNPGSHCYGTAVAERPFAQPMQVGDVFSADIDTPAEYDNYADAVDGYPFAIIGFRDADLLTTFGIEAGGDVEGPGPYPWRYDDLNHFGQDYGTDAGVGPMEPTITSDGSAIRLEILSATTGRFTLDGVSLDITFKFGLPKSVLFTLYDNNAEADAMGNPTSEHAFYFNNLKIERPPFGVPGDYNGNSVVDAADYVLWRNGGPLQNEVATPGTVTPDDYNEWRSRFGNTSGAGSVAGLTHVVPEPSTAILAAAVVLACILWRN